MKKLIEWVEIPTVDFKRAVNFYNNGFKFSMEEHDCGTEKMACFLTGEGAVFTDWITNCPKNGIVISMNVPDSIEETAARIERNSGKIVLQKTKIEAEGRGYFALFLDSEGNKTACTKTKKSQETVFANAFTVSIQKI